MSRFHVTQELKDILLEIFSVVIGIAITFYVQGRIDEKHEREGILAGLKLVKKELAENIQDIRYAQAGLRKASDLATSILDSLRFIPDDALYEKWDDINTEGYLTIPEDALQMFKSTYLFSDLLDREVSLSIVRAYDICKALERQLNKTCELRIDAARRFDEFFLMEADRGKYPADLRTRLASFQGRKILQDTAKVRALWVDEAVKLIEGYIASIDAYISR